MASLEALVAPMAARPSIAMRKATSADSLALEIT
jgi:hypothetical protein